MLLQQAGRRGHWTVELELELLSADSSLLMARYRHSTPGHLPTTITRGKSTTTS